MPERLAPSDETSDRAPATGDEPVSFVACWRRRAASRHPGPSTTPAAVVQLQHAAVVKFHNSGQGPRSLSAILICHKSVPHEEAHGTAGVLSHVMLYTASLDG